MSNEPIVGRDAEVASLASLLERGARGPAALLLHGEAGIGKTTIWRTGVERASSESLTVLTSRPNEAETRLPFAALGDLLDRVPAAVLDGLSPPLRRALEIALLRTEPDDEGLQQRAIGVGFLGVIGALADAHPLVIAIDDAQWLDGPSASVLTFAIRRLRGERVAILVAERSAGPAPDVLALGRSLPGGSLETIDVGRLTAVHLERVLREKLGLSLPRSTLRRVYELSAGNPFFALEIGRALMRQDADVETTIGVPVPDTLRELVLERLYRLPGPSRDALTIVAALSRPTIALVHSALGRRADVGRALARAADRGVIEIEGSAVRFSHPLLGSVLYAELAPDARRRLHRRLAMVVDDEDERPQHLALAATGPDASVAAALEGAANRVRRRGAPDAAANLADAARRMTPAEDGEALERRTLAAAEDYLDAGMSARAAQLLEPLTDILPSGRALARALLGLARVRMFDRGMKVAQPLLERAAAAAGNDPLLRASIGRDLAIVVTQRGDLREAEAGARDTLAWAEQTGVPALLSDALVRLALVDFLLGHGIREDLLGRAAQLETDADGSSPDGVPAFVPSDLVWGALLKWSDRFDEARARFDAVRRWAAASGTETTWTSLLFQAGELELWAGNMELAQQTADEARAAADRRTPDMQQEYAYLLAAVAAHRGDIDAARATTATARAQAELTDDLRLRIRCHALEGFIDLSIGRPAAAVTPLRQAMDLFRVAGYDDPAVIRFVPDLVEALLASGEHGEAARLQEWLDERGRTLDRPYALATGARCRALVLAVSGDLGLARAAIAEAVEHHQRLPQPFELARTRLVQGGLLRRSRAKREARAALMEALTAFDTLGAGSWSQRSRAELARISGRTPTLDGLTPTEARVAGLAAEGYANQEIAERLFVSPKTVEAHLTRVYDKLGVRSRGELARRSRSGEIPDFGVET